MQPFALSIIVPYDQMCVWYIPHSNLIVPLTEPLHFPLQPQKAASPYQSISHHSSLWLTSRPLVQKWEPITSLHKRMAAIAPFVLSCCMLMGSTSYPWPLRGIIELQLQIYTKVRVKWCLDLQNKYKSAYLWKKIKIKDWSHLLL